MTDASSAPTLLHASADVAARAQVRRLLQPAGWRVLEAQDGAGALARAATERPDVILLEEGLPDGSADALCARLRALPGGAPGALLQALPAPGAGPERPWLREGGADAYLARPWEPAELLALVRSLGRLRRTERELQRREEALADLDRRRDEFLAMVAHELRNPLAAIMTASGILERREAADGKEARMRTIIRRQTQQLARLVDGLLDVGRISRRDVALEREVVDLVALLGAALERVRPACAARDLALEVRLPEGPLWMMADAARLEQVFGSLLDNAIRYTDAGGRVWLALEREEGQGQSAVRVRVGDTGIGIAPECLPHVFGVFTPLDPSLEHARGGVGLGLALARSLVHLHGGELSAHSEGKGYGSEFRVRLPLLGEAQLPAAAALQASASASAAAAASHSEVRRRRVLLVEDNQDACAALRELLELWGHDVAVAPDGLAGLALALEQPPELALVDIGLPGMDGLRVASELRARVGEQLRLVAISGYGRPEDQRRALQAGFDLHLVKPVQPDELSRVLGELAS